MNDNRMTIHGRREAGDLNRKNAGRSFGPVVAVLLLLLLPLAAACRDAGEASSVSEVSVEKVQFATAREAKRALLDLADAGISESLVTDEWYEAYRSLRREINEFMVSAGNDEECIEKCVAYYGRMTDLLENIEYIRPDVARIYISCDSEINSEEYVSAEIYVIDTADGGNGDVHGTVKVRVRGNSTAAADKKPYNIKFEEKISLLGMSEGKKWCLLANHFDKTLIRNKLAYDFAAVCGTEYPIESEFVDVYVNGVLQGSYLLTEPVSDGKNRVDITTENGEFIVERLMLWEGGYDFITSPGGYGFAADTPAADEMTDAQRAAISEVLNAVDSAVASGDESRIRDAIDVDSFVSMYVLHELLKDCDITYNSSYFFYKNGRLYAGPLWDMDLSMGNVSHLYFQDKYHIYNNDPGFGDGSGDSASGIWAQQDWYRSLMKCGFFRDEAIAKYMSLLDDIEYLYKDGGYIDTLAEKYEASFKRNYGSAGWSVSFPYSEYELECPAGDYAGNLKWLKDWLYRRDMYLRGYFGIE